jgi:hypothetical protein
LDKETAEVEGKFEESGVEEAITTIIAAGRNERSLKYLERLGKVAGTKNNWKSHQ